MLTSHLILFILAGFISSRGPRPAGNQYIKSPLQIFPSVSMFMLLATLFHLHLRSLNKFTSDAERPVKVKVTSCKTGIGLEDFR